MTEALSAAFAAERLDEEVRKLEAALGTCERIMRTPIPTSYTRHTSRFLFMWTMFLPFALWDMFGFYGTVPASMVMAYVFLGIEDIGVVIEEPFEVLPMWRYAAAIEASCDGAARRGVESTTTKPAM